MYITSLLLEVFIKLSVLHVIWDMYQVDKFLMKNKVVNFLFKVWSDILLQCNFWEGNKHILFFSSN